MGGKFSKFMGWFFTFEMVLTGYFTAVRHFSHWYTSKGKVAPLLN
jgi:hypothetical protein